MTTLEIITLVLSAIVLFLPVCFIALSGLAIICGAYLLIPVAVYRTLFGR